MELFVKNWRQASGCNQVFARYTTFVHLNVIKTATVNSEIITLGNKFPVGSLIYSTVALGQQEKKVGLRVETK